MGITIITPTVNNLMFTTNGYLNLNGTVRMEFIVIVLVKELGKSVLFWIITRKVGYTNLNYTKNLRSYRIQVENIVQDCSTT